jgi:protein-ribulosamine 3-kinase
MPWEAVAASIAAATGSAFRITECSEVRGGCINRGYRLAGGATAYFVKLNRAGRGAMFEAEAEGLRAIAQTGTVRAPLPLCTGEDERHCWLVLEYLALARGDAGAMPALGRGLAALHRSSAEGFGWQRDNTIGATPQPNR